MPLSIKHVPKFHVAIFTPSPGVWYFRSRFGPSQVVLRLLEGAVGDSGDGASIVSIGGVASAEPGGGEAVCDGAAELL